MSDYILSCCSTSDLTEEDFKARDIHYVCSHFILNGKSYPDDLGRSIAFPDFYDAMAAGAETSTFQINEVEFEEYFEPFLKEGKDILHLCLSGGITGVINSARLAAEELMERYQERKIYIVDSLAASAGCGLIMDKLADLRDQGMGLEELWNWVEANKLKMHHWFFTSDLTYLIKGGRISKTSGFVGTMLNICPLLNINSEGKLIPRYKIRTKKKVIRAIVDRMEECAEGGLEYSGKCYMAQAHCEEDAREVADLIEERFPKLNGKVKIYYVGTTIGSHTGPGTVAVFFWGKEREL